MRLRRQWCQRRCDRAYVVLRTGYGRTRRVGFIYLKSLKKRTGQGQSAIFVDYTPKIITCREQQNKLFALEMELAAAKQECFVPKHFSGNDQKHPTENTDRK